MKMIGHDHFICHSYCHFSVLSHILLSDRTWRSGRSLMTSSDSVSKIISCCFSCFVSDFFYYQYGICRMYSKENPQYFRLPVSGLYPWERVMLLLSAEASFKPCCPFFWEFASKHLPQRLIFGRPSLAHKGCGYPIFCTELSVGIIGIYGIGSHTSYPYRKGWKGRLFGGFFIWRIWKPPNFSGKTIGIGKTEFPLEIYISGIRRFFLFVRSLFHHIQAGLQKYSLAPERWLCK